MSWNDLLSESLTRTEILNDEHEYPAACNRKESERFNVMYILMEVENDRRIGFDHKNLETDLNIVSQEQKIDKAKGSHKENGSKYKQ